MSICFHQWKCDYYEYDDLGRTVWDVLVRARDKSILIQCQT